MAGMAVMVEPHAFFTDDVDVGSVIFYWILAFSILSLL